MNIQQFYKKTASISLSVSLTTLIPPFFLIIYGIMIARDGRIVLIVLPFLVYSFFCYQNYLIYDIRSKAYIENILDDKQLDQTLLKTDQILIHFLPAPALRILFFSSEGQLLGELKERKLQSITWFLPRFLDRLFEKKYGLYDESNHMIAIFTLNRNQIEITDKDQNIINIVSVLDDVHLKTIFKSKGEEIVVTRTHMYMDFQFFLNQIRVSRLQKGIMPIEWENKIKDPNTPVFSFEKSLCDEQKLNMFAILVKILH